MRLKGGRDLLLAHKDLVVVLDEAARTVTREDVPGVGVGYGAGLLWPMMDRTFFNT